MNNWK